MDLHCFLLSFFSNTLNHQTITTSDVLEELANGVSLSSVAPSLSSQSRTLSSDASEVVVGDAIVAGGHGAGIAVRAGRVVVVRTKSMALTQ